MFQFSNGGIVVTVEKNGCFHFSSDFISLRNCLPRFAMEEQELPKCTWDITASPDQILLNGINTIGKWELTIRATRNKAGHEGVALRMKGTLNTSVHDLDYALFSGANADLTHFQGQGQRMGGAKSCCSHLRRKTNSPCGTHAF